ncbi:MAG: hypothetical protein QM296_08650 [Bacillota bacterium]|nr:hypothetical protein [Bacillota bacterium]
MLSERRRLGRLIVLIQNEIATIKSSYPYILLEILQDIEQLTRKHIELEDMLQTNEDARPRARKSP